MARYLDYRKKAKILTRNQQHNEHTMNLNTQTHNDSIEPLQLISVRESWIIFIFLLRLLASCWTYFFFLWNQNHSQPNEYLANVGSWQSWPPQRPTFRIPCALRKNSWDPIIFNNNHTQSTGKVTKSRRWTTQLPLKFRFWAIMNPVMC